MEVNVVLSGVQAKAKLYFTAVSFANDLVLCEAMSFLNPA